MPTESADYFWSCSTRDFYAAILKPRYVAAGTWPRDAMPVAEDIVNQFSGAAPAGYERGCDAQGLPCWTKRADEDLTGAFVHAVTIERQKVLSHILENYTALNLKTPEPWISHLKLLTDILAQGSAGQLQADALPKLPERPKT